MIDSLILAFMVNFLWIAFLGSFHNAMLKKHPEDKITMFTWVHGDIVSCAPKRHNLYNHLSVNKKSYFKIWLFMDGVSFIIQLLQAL